MRGAAGLVQQGVSLADAVFVQLYLADMGSFAAANRAYSRHFPAVSPAARACIQTPLPEGVPLAVDVLFRPGLPESMLDSSCMMRGAILCTHKPNACCTSPQPYAHAASPAAQGMHSDAPFRGCTFCCGCAILIQVSICVSSNLA